MRIVFLKTPLRCFKSKFECASWTTAASKDFCDISIAFSVAFRYAVDSPQHIHPSWAQFHQRGAKAAWMRFVNHGCFKAFLRYFNRPFNCVSTRFRKCETRSSLGSTSSKRSVNSSSISGRFSSSISGRFARGTSFRHQIWMCHWTVSVFTETVHIKQPIRCFAQNLNNFWYLQQILKQSFSTWNAYHSKNYDKVLKFFKKATI